MKSYILKYKYSFVFIFIAIIIRQLFLILSNYLNADAITVLTENNLNSFLKIILYLALVWVIIIAIDKVVKVRQEMFVQNIGISIKDELSNSLINKDVQHYKEKSSGTYQSWFNNDIQAIQNKGVKNIFALLYSISGMVFSLVALFRYHWIISLLTVIIGYLSGISNPKLDSLILHSVPEDKQTSIYSIFSTIITLTVPLGTVIILFISNAISTQIALYSLLVLLILLVIYSFSFSRKEI